MFRRIKSKRGVTVHDLVLLGVVFVLYAIAAVTSFKVATNADNSIGDYHENLINELSKAESSLYYLDEVARQSFVKTIFFTSKNMSCKTYLGYNILDNSCANDLIQKFNTNLKSTFFADILKTNLKGSYDISIYEKNKSLIFLGKRKEKEFFQNSFLNYSLYPSFELIYESPYSQYRELENAKTITQQCQDYACVLKELKKSSTFTEGNCEEYPSFSYFVEQVYDCLQINQDCTCEINVPKQDSINSLPHTFSISKKNGFLEIELYSGENGILASEKFQTNFETSVSSSRKIGFSGSKLYLEKSQNSFSITDTDNQNNLCHLNKKLFRFCFDSGNILVFDKSTNKIKEEKLAYKFALKI